MMLPWSITWGVARPSMQNIMVPLWQGYANLPFDINNLACWVKVSFSCMTITGPILLKQRRNCCTNSIDKSEVNHIQSIFGTQWLFPFSGVEGVLIRHTVFIKQCCENIRRSLAQWTGTWFLQLFFWSSFEE